MRKTLFLFPIFIGSILAQAQAPTNYYSSAVGKGYALKNQLHQIIKTNHIDKGYNGLGGLYAKNDVKNGFQDNYYENDGTLLDIYSENPTGKDPYTFKPGGSMGSGANEGSAYNREHLVPQSFFSEKYPMRSDAFHVWPADSKVNGWRSNFAMGTVANKENASPCNSGASNMPCVSKNGSAKGKLEGNSNITVFEPIDEFKGDVARAFLYFVTRYETQINGFVNSTKSNVKDMFDGSNDKVFNDTFLKIMLSWHQNDPVSPKEVDMNELIYNYQGNRNPFIDHPEFVTQIWDNVLSTEDEFNYQERNDVVVYSIANNRVGIKLNNTSKNIDQVLIYSLNGQLVNTVHNSPNNTLIEVSIPTAGIYILKIMGKNMEINKRIIIK